MIYPKKRCKNPICSCQWEPKKQGYSCSAQHLIKINVGDYAKNSKGFIFKVLEEDIETILHYRKDYTIASEEDYFNQINR